MRSIRFRLTAVATVLVAVLLTAAAITVVAVQRNALETSLDADLAARASAIELSLAGGIITEEVADPGNDERIIQIVDLLNRVVASSPNLAGAEPIADWSTGFRTIEQLPADEGPFRVLTVETTRTAEPLTIHVGESYEDVAESTAVLAGAMAVAVPGLSLLLGVLMWWLVGRALSPVEVIRLQVESIGRGEMHSRVPVPDTGDEISRLASTMNRMLERLEGSAERQRRFVSDASHELRSPLTRIRTMLEVDRRHPDTADQAASQAAVLEEAVRMQQLVDDLLHLARSDVDTEPPAFRPIDLDELIRAETDRLGVEHDVSIDTSGVDPVHLMGHSGQLTRLIRNLVENAIRHRTTRVAVDANEDSSGIHISVTDDGPGIPADRQEAVFERFARLDEARSNEDGGTGLGLAIARGIATAHGGSIRVDPSYTEGTKIIVTLPARHK